MGEDTDGRRKEFDAILKQISCRLRPAHLVRRGDLLRGLGAAGDAEGPVVQRPAEARSRRPRLGRVGREETQDEVKLIIQPDDGVAPVVQAIDKAKKTIDIVIFRFDSRRGRDRRSHAAVHRGVVVRALIAHTNKGGEKNLRKLELRLLEARRHGGADRRRPDALPRQDDDRRRRGRCTSTASTTPSSTSSKSRSFGIVTRDKQGRARGGASCSRPTRCARTTRRRTAGWWSARRTRARVLTEFIKGARKQLLIYDAQVSDNAIQKVLQERAKAGVEIRILGKLEKSLDGVKVRKLADAAAARPRHHPRRQGRVHRQPEPAQARAGRPARGRHHHQERPAIVRQDPGGLRGRLAEESSRIEGRVSSTSAA